MPTVTTSRRPGTVARPGYIYKPLSDVFYPKWKVLIIDQDSTVYTIADFNTASNTTNYLVEATVYRPHTEKQATATIKFTNPLNETTLIGEFTNKFTGGEFVEIYADYASATSLLFRGKVVDPKNSIQGGSGFTMEIEARDYPEMTDTLITGRVVSTRGDVALCATLDDAGFTDTVLQFWTGTAWATASYNSTTRVVTWDTTVTTFPVTTATLSWQDKKPWSIFQEICGRVGLDFYLEYDTANTRWLLRTFIKNDKKNNTMSITYGQNLVSLTGFGPENSTVFNAVTVYGKQESSNIIMLATEEDADSQSNLWKKELVINDSGLTSTAEVREKARFELQKNLINTNSGRVKFVGDASIRPGEQVMISIPHLAISGYHTISEIRQSINNSGFLTEVDITKFSRRMATLFKEKIDIERESEAALNLNDMKDSYNVFFDESPSLMTLSGCEESQGKLQLSTGNTTGVATTQIVTTSYEVTQCELRKYSNFPFDENDTYEVTADGGATWESYDITSGEIHTFATTGSRIGFRMTLNRSSVGDTSPAYESFVMLYK